MRLKRSGQTYQDFDCEYASISLTSGWSVVIAHRVDYLEKLDMASVSSAGHIITLALHDGIMISIAESWTSGQRDWRVLHEGQKHVEHLDARGRLPEHFAAAKSKCEDAIRKHVPVQTSASAPEMPEFERAMFERMGLKVTPVGTAPLSVDFHFDIPIDLANSLVGFRFDQPPHGLAYCELHQG
jgi:hypothetical protein